jgi:hypothetical protein
LLILVVLLSADLGLYSGVASIVPLADVTTTTTIFTTTTNWITSTIFSTTTQVVEGVLTTIEYTSSTSTVTVTGATTTRVGKIITPFGNARIRTAQSVFGGASGNFPGTNSYLSTPDSPDWAFGTGDFTIDFWIQFNTLPTSAYTIWSQKTDANNWQRLTFWNGGGGKYGFQFQVYSGGTTTIYVGPNYSTSWSTGTWYHYAIARQGTSFYEFKNGVQDGGTVTNSNPVPDLTGSLFIGFDTSAGGYYLNGWLDEFRVSKGVARWTSNFTPPTSQYSSDVNTVLLLHMDGTDGSATFTDSTI